MTVKSKAKMEGAKNPYIHVSIPRTLLQKLLDRDILIDLFGEHEVEYRETYDISWSASPIVRKVIEKYLEERKHGRYTK